MIKFRQLWWAFSPRQTRNKDWHGCWRLDPALVGPVNSIPTDSYPGFFFFFLSPIPSSFPFILLSPPLHLLHLLKLCSLLWVRDMCLLRSPPTLLPWSGCHALPAFPATQQAGDCWLLPTSEAASPFCALEPGRRLPWNWNWKIPVKCVSSCLTSRVISAKKGIGSHWSNVLMWR